MEDRLLFKFLKNEASAKEVREVLDWLDESPANREYLNALDEAVKLTAAQENGADVFTVKYGKIFLKPQRDYTVSYRNHNKVGKAELVITGNGEYAGTKTIAFRIKGRKFSAGTVKVGGIEDKVYTGRKSWKLMII